MSDPIVVPDADAKLVKESGQPSEAWYRIFLLWAAAFNADVRAAADEDTGLPSKAGLSQVDGFYGLILVPANQAYKLVVKLARAVTITETTTICTSGTCTATFSINSTPLGGTANSASSVEQSQAHASANVAAVGDDLTITISANSSCLNLSFSMAYTYELV